MADTEVIEVPLGVSRQEVVFHGRLRITWPPVQAGQPALAAQDLHLTDVDTGENVGLTTLALLCVRAGDAGQGAVGYLRACLLRLSDSEGVPITGDTTPIEAPPNPDAETLKAHGVGVAGGYYVAECWYAVAEMMVGEVTSSESAADDVGDVSTDVETLEHQAAIGVEWSTE